MVTGVVMAVFMVIRIVFMWFIYQVYGASFTVH